LKKKRVFLIPIRYWAKTQLETESGPAAASLSPLQRGPAETSLPQQIAAPEPTAQPAPAVVPLGPDPRRTEAKRRLCAPYQILTKSEPNWIKVGLEIEFNLLAKSPTEKPYKKVARWPSIPSNSAATLTSLPAVIAPLNRIFRPTEALSSTAGTRRCRWSAPHREPVTREAPDDREPEGRSPAVANPRRHPPLPPSKQNEFPTSLRFFRRRWHPKRTTVDRDRRNSDELGQPVMEHRRSAWWRRRPLPNLICTVHHKPSG
jgi:hypothetical protein